MRRQNAGKRGKRQGWQFRGKRETPLQRGSPPSPGPPSSFPKHETEGHRYREGRKQLCTDQREQKGGGLSGYAMKGPEQPRHTRSDNACPAPEFSTRAAGQISSEKNMKNCAKSCPGRAEQTDKGTGSTGRAEQTVRKGRPAFPRPERASQEAPAATAPDPAPVAGESRRDESAEGLA